MWWSPLRAPTVPKAMPTSQCVSAQPRSTPTIASGRASVVRSRSTIGRPSSASRTGPPTRATSWPAAAKRSPSSRSTGSTRRSSPINRSCAAVSSPGSGGRDASAGSLGTGSKGTTVLRRRRLLCAGPAPCRSRRAGSPRGYHRGMPRPRSSARRTGARRSLRKVEETSAGGLVVDRTGSRPRAAIIGRLDRRGRLLWSLPKGHLEAGESAEDAAVREAEEETGIRGRVVAPLGTIDYWFVAEDRRIHKPVHHYLLEASGGELSDEDIEVDEVAWVPLDELRERLAYAGERRLADTAADLLADSA